MFSPDRKEKEHIQTPGHPFLQQTVSVLSDESRLKLVGLLSLQAYSLEELASSLGIKVSLVARHLRKLQHLGLVEIRPEKTGSLSRYTLNMESFRLLKTSWYTSQEPVSPGDEIAVDESIFEEWEREIIRRFFAGTRLTTIPAGRKNLEIIVRWFAHLFEAGACYQENEVNAIIQRHYHDYAFFKKDLVGRGFLRRDHGIFWRVIPSSIGSSRA
jgi:DNA-binding HxlR family transcriptional regulator